MVRGVIPILAGWAFLTAPAPSWAKGPTVKIEITGEGLASPVVLTDPKILTRFSIWNGPGVQVRNAAGRLESPAHLDPGRTDGRFIAWPKGRVARRANGRPRYWVSFSIGRHPPEKKVLGVYVVGYDFAPARNPGSVYLPTAEERAENLKLIMHGVEGQWFHASAQWEELVRPHIEEALSAGR